MRGRIGSLILVSTIFMGAAPAQQFSQSWHVGEHEATIFFGNPHPGSIVTGAPYSADPSPDELHRLQLCSSGYGCARKRSHPIRTQSLRRLTVRHNGLPPMRAEA